MVANARVGHFCFAKDGGTRWSVYLHFKMQVTPRRALALAGAVLTLVSFTRVCVLFLEALSAVRDERSQDSELLDVCASGIARGSMKMRAACLQAQSDRASPIVLKAVLRAVSVAFEDFSESVSSPGKLLIVVLFVLSSVFLPVTSWIKTMFPQDEMVGNPHIVVLAHDSASALGPPRLGFKRRLAGALTMRRGASINGAEFDLERDTHNIDFAAARSKWE